jgi:hypothetical protein
LPRSRKEIQSAFISFALDNDIVDIKSHHYLIYRNPKLKEIFTTAIRNPEEKIDTIHPNDLFRFLRRLMKPYEPSHVKRARIEHALKSVGPAPSLERQFIESQR